VRTGIIKSLLGAGIQIDSAVSSIQEHLVPAMAGPQGGGASLRGPWTMLV
jgi:hypothetical protein